MKTSRSVVLFQHEQPSEAAWDAASDLCAAWNARRTPVLAQPLESMWMGTFGGAEKPEFEALVAELEEAKERFGLVYQTSLRTEIEESDYVLAEFIQIRGVGPGSEARPFLLNEAEALGPPEPCPECGAQDIFDMPQTAPYYIDETLLDTDTEDERLTDEEGWDVVNLPNGQLLVSERFCEVLEDTGAKGYELIAVTSGTPPRPSERMFQLVAKRAVLIPCLEHSRFVGGPPCPTCGAARGALKTYFWMRAGWIGKDEIVSRHRRCTALLYFSRRLHDAIRAAGLNGIHRNDVMRICHHDD